ncbi:MAG: DUF1540 domain-containing protein [Oscillospiraceae bacterium]|jgi:hypothetical protein|nr:DUF1540 domain-containing protein [Oscillospiraceae bacterium]
MSTSKSASAQKKPQAMASGTSAKSGASATSGKQAQSSAADTRVACTVTNCTHYSNRCCDAKSIKVQGAPSAGAGPVAVDAKSDTCCMTFKAK